MTAERLQADPVPAEQLPPDHRRGPRRRGAALEQAILDAAMHELTTTGYARLTMERVAERAHASKASVYRRWPTRMELAFDAVTRASADPLAIADTGTLRGDLLAALRATATMLDGPAGEALRGLLGEALGDPERIAELRSRSHGTGRRMTAEVVRRAVERGELAQSAVTERRLEVGQAMLRQHFLFNGVPIPDEVVVGIVDEVLLPVFRSGTP